jgi:hypothetical protein
MNNNHGDSTRYRDDMIGSGVYLCSMSNELTDQAPIEMKKINCIASSCYLTFTTTSLQRESWR